MVASCKAFYNTNNSSKKNFNKIISNKDNKINRFRNGVLMNYNFWGMGR